MATDELDATFLADLSSLLEEYEALHPAQAPTSHHMETALLFASPEAPTEDRRQLRRDQAAQRKLKYRQKVKTERLSLRKQADDLSAKVVDIQRKQAHNRAQRAGNLSLSMWKAIATRQMERRSEAEEEQKRLRAAVMDRSRLINQMNAMLLACQQTDRLLLNQQRSGTKVDGDSVLKTFIGELDAVYAQTNEMMQGVTFKVSIPLGYNLKWKQEEGLSILESADATEFPFTFEKTCDAVSSLLLLQAEGYELLDGVEDPENTSAAKYYADYHFGPNDCSQLALYFAGRRYKETDRQVFASRALYEGRGEFEGFHSHETSWIVVRPSAEASLATNNSTTMELYSRLVPVGVASSSEKTGRFTKMLSNTLENETKEMTRMLENLLFDRP